MLTEWKKVVLNKYFPHGKLPRLRKKFQRCLFHDVPVQDSHTGWCDWDGAMAPGETALLPPQCKPEHLSQTIRLVATECAETHEAVLL